MDIPTKYGIVAAIIVAVCAVFAIYRFKRESEPRTALRRNFVATLPMWVCVAALVIAPKPYNVAYVWAGVMLAGCAAFAIWHFMRRRAR